MNPNIKDPKIRAIGALYAKVKVKGDFLFALAERVERSPNTLRNHWFGNFWNIPEELQTETKSFLKDYIARQDKKEALELV
jgi:hypothetical protein